MLLANGWVEGAGRVLFFNLWVENRAPQRGLDFVRASGADVVVLAEVIGPWIPALDGLADLYPHRVDCLERPGCDVVLLSRTPLLATMRNRPRSSRLGYTEVLLKKLNRPNSSLSALNPINASPPGSRRPDPLASCLW